MGSRTTGTIGRSLNKLVSTLVLLPYAEIILLVKFLSMIFCRRFHDDGISSHGIVSEETLGDGVNENVILN
jgi:hypothetical protein